MLDLACGTGLHAAYLAELGAKVTAADLSAEMIELAKRKRAHPGIHFQIGDMRTPPPGPWDLILCLGNSLALLPSMSAFAETLRTVQERLAPGGRFLLQILNAAAESAQKPRQRVEIRRLGEAEVVAVKSLVPHRDRTLLALTFFSRQGESDTSISESAILLNLDWEDLFNAAKAARLAISPPYGDFERTPLDPAHSTDIVCVLAKIG